MTTTWTPDPYLNGAGSVVIVNDTVCIVNSTTDNVQGQLTTSWTNDDNPRN